MHPTIRLMSLIVAMRGEATGPLLRTELLVQRIADDCGPLKMRATLFRPEAGLTRPYRAILFARTCCTLRISTNELAPRAPVTSVSLLQVNPMDRGNRPAVPRRLHLLGPKLSVATVTYILLLRSTRTVLSLPAHTGASAVPGHIVLKSLCILLTMGVKSVLVVKATVLEAKALASLSVSPRR